MKVLIMDSKFHKTNTPNPGGVSVTVVVILSVVVVLMFIVICIMCWILWRMRRNGYRPRILNPENGVINNVFDRQPSTEAPDSVLLKNINTFESPFKPNNILSMVETNDKEFPNTADVKTPTPKPLKLDKPANGTKLTMQPVITPDQMNKVCSEVLSKMKRNQAPSLTHLNELMQSQNNDDKTTDGEHTEFEDDFGEYDVLPRPKQLSGASDDGMDVYDSPPMRNSSDCEQSYYDNIPVPEDLYQNAKFVSTCHKGKNNVRR